jgi:hypothetical protein
MGSFLSGGRAVLGSEHFYRRMLEPTYERVVAAVKLILAEALPFIGLTVDGWSDLSSKVALLSVTGHVIQKGSKLKLCLATVPLEDSHTGEYMLGKILEALNFWEIRTDRVVSITRDNALNIVKTVRDFGSNLPFFIDVPCAQHTMSLVLEEGFESQPGAKKCLERVKEVVNHFGASLESPRRLEAIQRRADRPVLRLKGYCGTRWDSQLESVERVLEVEDSLRELCVQLELKVPVVFTDLDYRLMRALTAHLSLFREFRLEMSKDSATLGPLLTFIKQFEAKFKERTAEPGLGGMRKSQLRQLLRPERFGQVRERPGFLLAEALEPRFKTRAMSEEERERILDLLPSWLGHADELWAAWEAGRCEAAQSAAGSPAKRPRREEEESGPGQGSQLWPSVSDESVPDAEDWRAEFCRYEKSRRSGRDVEPATFWESEGKDYPRLRKLGLRLSVACPSQVPSEQLFSAVGLVSTKTRKSLLPENLERLVFLKKTISATTIDGARFMRMKAIRPDLASTWIGQCAAETTTDRISTRTWRFGSSMILPDLARFHSVSGYTRLDWNF